MSSVELDVSIDARPHYLQALRRVLRPIVRLMIRSGIRYDEFADAARAAYIESAIRDWDRGGPPPTRDQVAWITGINPERVAHYIERDESLPSIQSKLTDVAVEVLHRWHTDSHYLGSSGMPLELEFSAPIGPSFEHLVNQIDAQSNPELILERLLRARSVVRSDGERIRAVSRRFTWPEEVLSSSDYWGNTLARVIETHEYNFTTAKAENKRLERSVFADHGISEQLLPRFHAFAQERADQFLFELDDWLGQHSQESSREGAPKVAIGVNVFFYVEPRSDLTPVRDLVQPSRNLIRVEDGCP